MAMILTSRRVLGWCCGLDDERAIFFTPWCFAFLYAVTIYAASVCLADEPVEITAKSGVEISLKPTGILGDGRFKHAARITHISMLPNGTQALTSARDGTARLWDLESGREIRRFYHPDGEDIWNLQVLSKDRLLTCGEDQHVTLWDLNTGKKVRRFNQSTTIHRLAVLPGGKQFVAAGHDKVSVKWEAASGKQLLSFKGHTESVYGVSIAPDGRTMATCSDDKTIRIWDLKSGKELRKVRGHGGDIYTVVFAPNGKQLATCSDDSTVRLFEAGSGKEVWKAELSDDVTVVAWSPDGKRIAATCDDKHIYVFNAESGKEVLKIAVPGGYHWPVAYSPDGRRLYSAGDQQIYGWDSSTGKQVLPVVSEIRPMRGSVDALVLSADQGKLFVAGGDDEDRIHVWDRHSGKQVATWSAPGDVASLDISPDGKRLLAASNSSGIWILDSTSGEQLKKIEFESGLVKAAFVNGGRRVVAATKNKTLVIWDAQGRQLNELAGHEEAINDLAVSPDGRLFATASDDKTVRIWSAQEATQLAVITCTAAATQCAFLGDSRSLLVGCGDNTLHQWIAPKVVDSGVLSKERVVRLVGQLGADRFTAREKAQQELIGFGSRVLPYLKAIDSSDLEVNWRVKEVHQRLLSADIPTVKLGKSLSTGDTIKSLCVHPDGIHWVAALRYDAGAKLISGKFTPLGLVLISETTDGRSPHGLLFSKDGGMLYTGNRDSTISVYRVE